MSVIRLWRAFLRCTFFRTPVHRSKNWSLRKPMMVESRLTQVRIFRSLFDLLFTHNGGNTKNCGIRLIFKQRVIIQDWKYGQFINSLSGYSLCRIQSLLYCAIVRTGNPPSLSHVATRRSGHAVPSPSPLPVNSLKTVCFYQPLVAEFSCWPWMILYTFLTTLNIDLKWYVSRFLGWPWEM